jgi:hypothetical protein
LWRFRVKVPDIMLVQVLIAVMVQDRRGLKVFGQSLFDLGFKWCEFKRWKFEVAR